MTCPGDLDLARGRTKEHDADLLVHLADCAACRDAWNELTTAIELARSAHVDIPSAEHREQVRTALLARISKPRPAVATGRRKLAGVAPVLAAFAAAAAIAVFVVAPHHDARAPQRGHLHPHASARVELASPSPDEIVRVHDGTVAFDVDPLEHGERFRVVVGGSEVEVRGTSFTVTAASDRLVAVAVARGRVEVRPAGGESTVLIAGESWYEPTVVTSEPPAPAPIVEQPWSERSVAPPAPARSPRTPARLTVAAPTATQPAATPTAPEDVAYNAGWAALRADRFHAAAAEFARTVALAPDGGLADDARFWHAVALAREPRVVDAIAAFRELVNEHPDNPHRGEASVMLGWLLVDARELTEAARRFEAAADDPSERVRSSARAGLEALARKKAP